MQKIKLGGWVASLVLLALQLVLGQVVQHPHQDAAPEPELDLFINYGK